MTKVVARSIAEPDTKTLQIEVLAIEARLGTLRIEVCELGGSRRLEVRFAATEAFRVMHERDLGDYWPTCSTPNGWIFEVTAGGWLSQEFERPDSLVAKIHSELQEFLIAGVEDCVSILSLAAPEVRVLNLANEA